MFSIFKKKEKTPIKPVPQPQFINNEDMNIEYSRTASDIIYPNEPTTPPPANPEQDYKIPRPNVLGR